MSWNVVEVEKGKKNRALPSASIGFGRISLNVSACNLMENFEQYKYVELLTDPEKPSAIGMRFLKEATGKSIPAKRKTVNGKITGGLEISGKYYMQKLFGIAGTQKRTTRYSVTKETENILVINTSN
ncbi:MAG: hypothetical protein K2F83_07185 [Oscillospiraceae bacterium]|nr:hypothetical protein [Oscillospiraceae bacterium]